MATRFILHHNHPRCDWFSITLPLADVQQQPRKKRQSSPAAVVFVYPLRPPHHHHRRLTKQINKKALSKIDRSWPKNVPCWPQTDWSGPTVDTVTWLGNWRPLFMSFRFVFVKWQDRLYLPLVFILLLLLLSSFLLVLKLNRKTLYSPGGFIRFVRPEFVSTSLLFLNGQVWAPLTRPIKNDENGRRNNSAPKRWRMVARKRAKKFRRYGWTQKKSAVYPPNKKKGRRKKKTRDRERVREREQTGGLCKRKWAGWHD